MVGLLIERLMVKGRGRKKSTLPLPPPIDIVLLVGFTGVIWLDYNITHMI